MPAFEMRNQACIVGIGTSEFGRNLDVSPILLQTQAYQAALDDAGLTRADIDGFSTSHGAPAGADYDEFAMHTGSTFRWAQQNWTHGRWAGSSVSAAMFAVCSGLANYVLIANTQMESPAGYRRHFPRGEGGWNEGLRDVGGGQGQVNFHGLDTPGSATSLATRYYMEKYGATSEELGSIAVSERAWANLNPQAIFHDRPMTLDDYMDARFISAPLRLFDYCLVNEGAQCIIVTTAERAKDLKKPPVYIAGYQGIQTSRDSSIIFARPGLGIGLQRDFHYDAGVQDVYRQARVDQSDVDAVYIYDSVSPSIWFTLERFGFAKDGEAHEFTQEGRIAPGGALPVNTSGGSLSEAGLFGYNSIAEMTRQLRGNEAGARQVPNAEVMQWMTPFGDSLILTKGN